MTDYKEKETTGVVNNAKQKKEPKLITNISDNVLVKVKSGFHGKLYYKNLVTKEPTIWEHAGDIQIMSMSNLRAMKAQQVSFFKNQWVIILGVADGESCKATAEDICRILIVSQYYENFIDPSKFDAACNWNEDEIAEKVSLMSVGAKENLVVALNGFIKSGRLDSIRKIKAFEKALGCELLKE